MNNCFISTTAVEIKNVISDFKDSHKILFSNYYGVNELENFEILKTDLSILIRKKEHDFYRLFLLSADEKDLIIILQALQEDTYVLNIPTKKGVEDWQNILALSGFSFLAQYDRYYNKQIEYRESEVGDYAVEEDAPEIMNLLYSNDFSIYTDYLPTKERLSQMICNKQVLANKVDGHILGVLIYTIEGKKCYLNIWIDRSKDGLYLLFDAYNIMVEKGIGLAYFWVKSTNKKIIKLHKLTGAISDGLSDYSYIKNK